MKQQLRIHWLLPALLCATFAPALQAADPAETVNTRLRESLRNTMVQLRTAQTDLATAQAAQTEGEAKAKELAAQLSDLTLKADAERAAADQERIDRNAKIENGIAEIARLNEALEKWKAGYQKVVDAGQTTEAARAKLAQANALLARKVEDQQMRNSAMFQLGQEILLRYEKFGIGEALTAREPFVGITRVKFENLIQDYQDKLADQKIKP